MEAAPVCMGIVLLDDVARDDWIASVDGDSTAYKTGLVPFGNAVAGEAATDSTAVATDTEDADSAEEDPAVPVEVASVERRFVAALDDRDVIQMRLC